MKTSKPASYSGFSQFDGSVAIPNREFKAIILNCNNYASGIVNITYIDTKGITKTYTVTVMRLGLSGKFIIIPIAGRQLISLTNVSSVAFTLNDIVVTLLN